MDDDRKPITAQELVDDLIALIAKHGDLPVVLPSDNKVLSVVAYDKDGNTRGKRVEFVIHEY